MDIKTLQFQPLPIYAIIFFWLPNNKANVCILSQTFKIIIWINYFNLFYSYNYPCLCLCLGFSQITLITPFLLITLHLSHIFFTDGLTFIFFTSLLLHFCFCVNNKVTLPWLCWCFASYFLFCSPSNSTSV